MEACELVRLIVNKTVVPAEPKRRGNPGYGQLKAIRILVYARLKGLQNDTRIYWHLKKHPIQRKKAWITPNTRQNHDWPMVETLPKTSRRDIQKDRRYHSGASANHTSNR